MARDVGYSPPESCNLSLQIKTAVLRDDISLDMIEMYFFNTLGYSTFRRADFIKAKVGYMKE